MKRLLVPLLVLGLSCEDHHQVRLVLGGATETRLPQAFRCRDAAGTRALITRTFTPPSTVSFNVVVDFIRLGGLPYASVASVVTWCEDHDCTVMPPRFCLPLSTTVAGPAEIGTGVGQLLQDLKGQMVVGDAPDEAVIVRLVATREPCSSVTPTSAFVLDDLVACAVSVPIDGFDSLEGDVVLELPALNDRCEEQVFACATSAFE